jgi:limonene-1,2-epoxide hydrolase
VRLREGQTTSTPTVETFHYARQDEDFDIADSVLADNVVRQNVGVLTLRGRERIVRLLRRGQGRAGVPVVEADALDAVLSR